MAKTATQHIVKSSDKWAVRKGGSTKATRLFDTQEEAINYGRQIARNQKAEFYIHARNGRIRSKDSYGNDDCPPKDKNR